MKTVEKGVVVSMYCKNCGKELSNNSKFCGFCGSIVEKENDNNKKCPSCNNSLNGFEKFCPLCGYVIETKKKTNNDNNDSNKKTTNIERSKVYDGVVHKCPSCGEILKTFSAVCPSCGYELRNVEVNSNLKDFYTKYENMSYEKKVSFITNYPVPNSKEDIVEFMHYGRAQINDDYYLNPIEDAWRQKIENLYKKAKLSIKNEEDMKEINMVYNDLMDYLYKYKRHSSREKNKKIVKIASIVIGAIIAIIIAMALVFNIIENNKNKKILLDPINSAKINANNGYNNDYSKIYDNGYITVYRLKLAKVSYFEVALSDYSNAYDANENIYQFDPDSINKTYVANNMDELMGKNSYGAIKLDTNIADRYNLYISYDKNLISFIEASQAYAKEMNGRYYSNTEDEYNMLLTCSLEYYVYEVYDSFKNEKNFYYNFKYSNFNYNLVLSDASISVDSIKLSQIDAGYNPKTELTSYSLSFQFPDEKTITDAGLAKNQNDKIDIFANSAYSYSDVETYGYNYLTITVKFDIYEMYHGEQEIRLCNNEDYNEYLHTVKKEFSTDTKKTETFETEYKGVYTDLSIGKLFIYYDASGSGDDDYKISNVEVNINFSKE